LLYLLDADVLIRAKNEYYEFDRVPEYWDWLSYQSAASNMKLALEIWEEITQGKDELADWAKNYKEELVLQEDVDVDLVQRVINEGYAPDLTDIQVEKLGRDPFLIAYGLASPADRMIVTREVRSNKQRQNRKVPNVCDDLGVMSCDPFKFGRDLDFRTNWKRP